MTVLYRISHIVPNYEVEENIEVFANFQEAKKYFKTIIKSCQDEYAGEQARCYFEKITLNTSLTTKQLMIAMLSGKGYAESIEEIEHWEQ